MLNKYKNELYEIIKGQSGFDISEFIVRKQTNNVDSNALYIKHKVSKFEFVVGNIESSFDEFEGERTTFTPNYQKIVFNYDPCYGDYGPISFYDVKAEVIAWIEEIKQYLDDMLVPDNWSNFYSADDDSLGDLVEFTTEEKSLIKGNIEDVKTKFKNGNELNLSDHQVDYIVDRLSYLSDAVDRLNKFDWKGVVINTILTIGTTLGLTIQNQQVIIALLRSAFSGIANLLK